MSMFTPLPAFIVLLAAVPAAASDPAVAPPAVVAIAADAHLHVENLAHDPALDRILLVEKRRDSALLRSYPNLSLVEPAYGGDPRPALPAGPLQRFREERSGNKLYLWHTDTCGGVWREEIAGTTRRLHPIHVGYVFTPRPDGGRDCTLIRNETELERLVKQHLPPQPGEKALTGPDLLGLSYGKAGTAAELKETIRKIDEQLNKDSPALKDRARRPPPEVPSPLNGRVR